MRFSAKERGQSAPNRRIVTRHREIRAMVAPSGLVVSDLEVKDVVGRRTISKVSYSSLVGHRGSLS